MELRDSITNEIEEVHQKLEALNEKIDANIRSDMKQFGLLTNGAHMYK